MNPQNAQQFRELLWEMKITVKISILDSNIPALYLQIYRQHYLLFYYQQIYEHFNSFQPMQYKLSQLCLNFKNQTLPYQVPFGVLVDCMQQEEIFTPIALTLIFQQTEQFDDLEKEMKNQLKFNLKWASLGRYNHPGYGVPLKLLQQYTKASEEEKIFKQIMFHFDQKESIYQYYQRIFEDSEKLIQIPVRIHFTEGGSLQTLLEIQDPAETIGTALKAICKDAQFIFCGVPLDLNIPAMYFYAYLYYIDGFCYFVCK